jgi:hypothetical protein
MGGCTDICGNSAMGSQGELHEDSLVIMENPDKGDTVEKGN